MAKSLLTDAKIQGLKPESGKQLEHADSVVSGLRIRLSGRRKTWILRGRAGGKVRTFTLGEYGREPGQLTLAAARARGIEIREQIAGGTIPAGAAPRARKDANRVRDQIDAFQLRYAAERVKRPEAYAWMFKKYVTPHFGDWSIAAIKRRDLADFLDGIADQHGMTTARRVGGLLKRLFRFAVSRDVIDSDPAAALILPGGEVQRDRILTDSELRAFWRATDPASRGDERNAAGRLKAHPSQWPWGAYFRLLMLSGQRRAEVATMRWAAIDLDKRTWALEASEVKSARPHLVPLSEPAVALLKSLPRLTYLDDDGLTVPSPWVLTTNGRAPIADFSKPKVWLDEAMQTALQKEDDEAQLTAWRVHDIRRSVSTNLARLGVEPFVGRRVLNHALQGVDAIYDRFDYLESKRRALDLWAAHLLAIVEAAPPNSNVVSLAKAS